MGDGHAALIAALERAGCQPTQTRDGWRARCPAHEDKNPSLSVGHGDRKPVVLKCHAGCPSAAILVALGLDQMQVLAGGKSTRPPLGDPVAVYNYGTYEVVRYDNPKTLRQRRSNGHGGYTWSLKGIAP